MRFSRLLILFLLFNGGSLLADYLTSTAVGPGMVYHHEYRSAGPWHIQILEIDLTDSLNTLETVKAKNLIAGYEGTSAMAARSDRPEHRVVGAINGDFYASGGISIGSQIVQGTLLKRPYPRSVFALSEDKTPVIDILSFNGQVSKQDSITFPIQGINETRNENYLVLYNKFMGTGTGTNQWGTEVQVEYLDQVKGVNAPIKAVVVLKDSLLATSSGNMSIPASQGAVLSGHGTARDFLDTNIFVGDTLIIQLNLTPSSKILSELVGGTPRIIRNGNKSVEWEAESIGSSFANDRHPRTAVGFSADSTKVYFVTVDGRRVGYSVGMSLYELADYMLEWGMFQGVNLDGGGSTTMVVRGQVVNRPSDGSERSVANTLMAVSLAPQGPLAVLRLPWEETFTMVESQLQFSVKGFDSYYNPVSLTGMTPTWSCDTLIGSISNTGLFTAKPAMSDGYVSVRIGEVIDSVLVHVTDIASLSLQPNPVILKVGESQSMTPQARDNFNRLLQVDPESFDWTVPAELASISSGGVVTAEHVGSGEIQASFRGVNASVPLSIGFNSTAIIDDFNEANEYALSGFRVDLGSSTFTPSTEQFVSAPSSGKLSYSLTTGGVTVLYLDRNIPISGTPESISISVYGDNSGHWLRGEFRNAAGGLMRVNFNELSPGINWENSWRELSVPLTEAISISGSSTLSFPITWTRIYLAETDENKKNSGVLYFDDLKVNFITTDVNPEPATRPESFNLESNYPNPFNASTRFKFNIQTPGVLELRLFSLDGREVDTLTQNVHSGVTSMTWEPHDLPSGIYLYQASLAQKQISGKCLLLK